MLVTLTGFAWVAATARAATTWTVSSTADDDGTQACDAATSTCPTLRDAISHAAAGDTIVIPAGMYTLSHGQLAISVDLNLQGAGATVSGGGASRVFEIDSPNVTISGLTITDGNGDQGAASGNAGLGGAVYIAGAAGLTLTNSTVSNSGASDGGGIYAAGDLALRGSTITGNSAIALDPGQGGGLYIDSGTATLVNDTITGNSSNVSGGGIYQFAGLSLTNVTVASNSSPQGANWFDEDSGGDVQNTIIAGAQGGGDNCFFDGQGPTDGGNNLEDDAAAPPTVQNPNPVPSCEFVLPIDQSGVDPKLGPLADNGGPTQTMALQAGSPAIDKGATVSSVSTDQRGGPRPQGAAYDIGAYEVGAVVDMSLTKSASPNPVTAGQPLTYTLTATNNGPTSDPADGVTVTDTPPSAVTFQSASASQGSCSSSSGTVTCQLGTVNKGSSATVTIKVTPSAAGTVTNTGRAASSGLDPNPANNSASVSTQVQAAAVQASNGTKPVALTEGVTGLTFTTATLHGAVAPGGASTTYFFEYGTKVTDPNTPSKNAGSGTKLLPVSQRVTGLRPGTLYHYRIVATNANGTSRGVDRTFRTPRRPSLHVLPGRVLAGARVRVFGNAGGCRVGDRVTLMSQAFSHAHEFAGVPAVYARVGRGGAYSTFTRIPAGRSAGHYLVTARCGGGNLGVSASLTVYRPPVPRFTG